MCDILYGHAFVHLCVMCVTLVFRPDISTKNEIAGHTLSLGPLQLGAVRENSPQGLSHAIAQCFCSSFCSIHAQNHKSQPQPHPAQASIQPNKQEHATVPLSNSAALQSYNDSCVSQL